MYPAPRVGFPYLKYVVDLFSHLPKYKDFFFQSGIAAIGHVNSVTLLMP